MTTADEIRKEAEAIKRAAEGILAHCGQAWRSGLPPDPGVVSLGAGQATGHADKILKLVQAEETEKGTDDKSE